MKIPSLFHFSAILALASLSACHGPVVRTIESGAAQSMELKRPSVMYALKRSRFNVEYDLRFIQVMPSIKVGDKFEPLRGKVTYRIDFAKVDGVKLTASLEPDPNLVFAIYTDSAESWLTDIKNFEVKVQADGTLESVNGQFEDTTLKVATNLIATGVNVIKFAGNVALGAAGAPQAHSVTEDKIVTTVLDAPQVRGNRSLTMADFIHVADAKVNNVMVDLLAYFKLQVEAGREQLKRQHAALNEALRADLLVELKTKDAELAKKPGLSDAQLLEALGKGATYFYPTEADVENIPSQLVLRLTDFGSANLIENTKLDAGKIVTAARTAHKIEPKESAGFGGIFYRRSIRGSAGVGVAFKTDFTDELLLVSQNVPLPEAGAIGYTNIDARLFTTRNSTVTYNTAGEISSYKLSAGSAADALTAALSTESKNVLGALQEVKRQKETDAIKAKTDAATAKTDADKAKSDADKEESDAKKKLQDGADVQLRIMAQEDLIYSKQQAIEVQERVVATRQRERNEAQAEFDNVKADLELTGDSTADTAKKNKAQQARRTYLEAEDALYQANATLDLNRFQKTRLEDQLAIVKSGLTVSPAKP